MCRMEYHFQSVSEKGQLYMLPQYVVKMVNMFEMDRTNGPTAAHRELIAHMLIQIQKLMLAERSLNVLDLAIACHKVISGKSKNYLHLIMICIDFVHLTFRYFLVTTLLST